MKGIGFYSEEIFTIKEDTDLYKENISRILLTSPGERVINQTFGSNFKSYLFALDTVMQDQVDAEISRAIERWEPRVTIKAIRTSRPDPNTFHLHLVCEINDTLETFDYEQTIRL